MRTTIVIDEDVSIEIERMADREKRTKKDIINDLLRKGLSNRTEKKQTALSLTNPFELGRCRYQNIDNISEVLSAAEAEDYK
jgi:hypothetical protein